VGCLICFSFLLSFSLRGGGAEAAMAERSALGTDPADGATGYGGSGVSGSGATADEDSSHPAAGTSDVREIRGPRACSTRGGETAGG
jgi:hypothetical protein